MTRREFMIGSAALGLAGCRTCGETKGRILFGACRSSVEDVVRMKAAGYDFWEWGVGAAFDPDKDAEWWKRQKDEIAKRPLPLRSCNGFLPGRFRLTGPKADPEPALRYAETALRRADEIGVRTLVFGSADARNVPGDMTAADRSQRPDFVRGREQLVAFCRELCRRISDLKTVQVVLEPLRAKEANIVNYVWQGLEICREVDSPRFAQLADIFHMMEGREGAESIVEAGPLLRHCHIADWRTRSFPGDNPAETHRLRPYFDALRRIGYAGGVSCECDWRAKGAEIAKHLETALNTMKGLV